MKKTITILVLIIAFRIPVNAQYVSGKLSKITILPEQTVSVILTSDESMNASIKETMKLYWKKCKYEFVTMDEIANKGKLGDYYLMIQNRGFSYGGGIPSI